MPENVGADYYDCSYLGIPSIVQINFYKPLRREQHMIGQVLLKRSQRQVESQGCNFKDQVGWVASTE